MSVLRRIRDYISILLLFMFLEDFYDHKDPKRPVPSILLGCVSSDPDP
jgi:hypothetical protein